MKIVLNTIVLALFFTFLFSCNGKQKNSSADVYTCSMHPEVRKNAPGDCPICHMPLVKMNQSSGKDTLEQNLNTSEVISAQDIPVVQMEVLHLDATVDALGNVAYDTQQIGSISSNVEGRIERLYIKYPFQRVYKGQKILEIYSPELLTAQQNLLFLLQNDAENQVLIDAAKQKIRLLGISEAVIQQVIKNKKAIFAVPVFSPSSGYVRDFVPQNSSGTLPATLSIREGKYVKKGEPLFGVYNAAKVWALLSIYHSDVANVKKGLDVEIYSELYPEQKIGAKINFIEPFYRKDSKTLTVRANFDNTKWKLPVGSSLRAKILFQTEATHWLPKSAVVSLGHENVVYVKNKDVFIPQKVKIGHVYQDKVAIESGLLPHDFVAESAQYFRDNESFIKLNTKEE